jgi:Uma2 family endonuclease
MAVLESANVAELIAHLGVPPKRIRLQPPPGQATEDDVIRARPLCELIDGVLVEKAMGFWESRLAVLLGHYIESYLDDHDIGFTLGEGGMQRVEFGQVRLPDLSFYLWSRFPNRELTLAQILDKVADLAVEVLSPSNTEEEMNRKRREFFAAGASLFWIVDPEQRTVEVFTAPEQSLLLTEADTLDGGNVLPGFKLSIREWFTRAGKRA